jgi:hypothetical protein
VQEDLEGAHFDVRNLLKAVAEPHLSKDVDAALLQALTAEGAGKVVMRFQHGYCDATPGQQKSQRHSGRAGTDNHDPTRVSGPGDWTATLCPRRSHALLTEHLLQKPFHDGHQGLSAEARHGSNKQEWCRRLPGLRIRVCKSNRPNDLCHRTTAGTIRSLRMAGKEMASN